jgi:predicted ATPase
VLWLLGYPDQALRCSEENLAILRSQVPHPYSVAFGLSVAAFLRQYLGDLQATRALAEEALVISEAHGLAFIDAMASMFEGWVRTREGELDEGMAQMRRGLAAQLATGAELGKPYWLWLLAEVCQRTSAAREGLALLDDADATIEHTHEHYWEAEIHRLRGRLLLATAEPAASAPAEACYRRALDVARRQGARSLELRAAVSLSRLWQAADRHDKARELLAPIYERFTEGLDHPELREAAALLDELSFRHEPDLTPLDGER